MGKLNRDDGRRDPSTPGSLWRFLADAQEMRQNWLTLAKIFRNLSADRRTEPQNHKFHMDFQHAYYSRLDGKIGQARPLQDFLSDESYTPAEIRRMEVRRTGTEYWVALVSLFDSKGVPLPSGGEFKD